MNKNTEDENIAFILIDSPISLYSSKDEIIAWIRELNTMPNRPEVEEEIEKAHQYLAYNEKNDKRA